MAATNTLDPNNDLLDLVIRVSRKAGREGSSFLSPSMQRDVAYAWAKANGKTIRKEWDESESVSGGTTDRKGLQAAMLACKRGETGGIIVAKVDRFARTLSGGLLAVEQLQEWGKSFVAVKDGLVMQKGQDRHETAMGELLLAVLLLFAKWERDGKRANWADIKELQLDNGIHVTEPFGYRKDSELNERGKEIGSRVLMPVAEEAAWVVGAFERRAGWFDDKVWPWQKIADWLNENGVEKRGKGRWVVNGVIRMIESRVYLGEIHFGDEVRTGTHKAIVPLDLWTDANATRRSSARANATDLGYPLTGYIRCAGCGVKMVGASKRRPVKNDQGEMVEKIYRYYKCKRDFTFGVCPAPASVLADEVEGMVEEIFVTQFLNPCCDRRAEGEVATVALEDAIREEQAADADLMEFLESEVTIEMGRALGRSYVEKGQQIRTERLLAAQNAVAEARNAVLGVELPFNFSDLWPTLDADEKAGFLAKAFPVIAVERKATSTSLPRIGIWTNGHERTPRGLPDRKRKVNSLTPISVDYAPAGAWETAA
jgi:DNA invertase Pin-like site-specific DNA recombinase